MKHSFKFIKRLTKIWTYKLMDNTHRTQVVSPRMDRKIEPRTVLNYLDFQSNEWPYLISVDYSSVSWEIKIRSLSLIHILVRFKPYPHIHYPAREKSRLQKFSFEADYFRMLVRAAGSSLSRRASSSKPIFQTKAGILYTPPRFANA